MQCMKFSLVYILVSANAVSVKKSFWQRFSRSSQDGTAAEPPQQLTAPEIEIEEFTHQSSSSTGQDLPFAELDHQSSSSTEQDPPVQLPQDCPEDDVTPPLTRINFDDDGNFF